MDTSTGTRRLLVRCVALGIVAVAAGAWPRSLGKGDSALSPKLRAEPQAPSLPRDAMQERLAAEALRRMPELGAEGADCLASVVIEEASNAGLDPLFVFAIIEVESGWEPDAVSGRGARGLMQLRPGTLESEAREGSLTMGDPRDPVLNIRAGVRYFHRMLRSFGNADLALVAYNTGPTRLSSYIRAVGEVPRSFFGYVRRVRREEQRLRTDFGMPEMLAANVHR